ncbi:hypothetical protein ACFPM0_03590 [Pseudonocardia sulfidoxydans]|uniref:hypothetical protein n=1 Tax=Pseudonocardia sulfidoxydans TaxID=54011 RepID=UPI00361D5445
MAVATPDRPPTRTCRSVRRAVRACDLWECPDVGHGPDQPGRRPTSREQMSGLTGTTGRSVLSSHGG